MCPTYVGGNTPLITESEFEAKIPGLLKELEQHGESTPRKCMKCGCKHYTEHQLDTLPVTDEDFANYMKFCDCGCHSLS